MVVVGGIIGAGIFINPYIVAQRLDSAPLVLAAWVAGGVVALCGALTFAELGSLRPEAGGHYAYLRDAYHPLAGFLYGWGLLLIIESGAIAAVAITFAQYALRLVGNEGAATIPLAVAAIIIVTVVNYFGVKPGSRLLNVFVVLKVAALAVLIVAGLLLPARQATVGEQVTGSVDSAVGATVEAGNAVGEAVGLQAPEGEGAGMPLFIVAFGAALIPVMFSYGGWQNANYVAEEIREPQRNVPRALILGTSIVVITYVFVNFVYLQALGHDGLAATLTPAADTARRVFGPAGDRFIAGAIAISTFGFLDLTVLAPSRVYYAMARDGVFFHSVARLHPRYQTPSLAIFIQSTWAIALALTGTYAQLVDYVVFADWIFFGAAAASLFVFRRRFPVGERPVGTFRTVGYPLVPGVMVVAALLIVASVLFASPLQSALGIVLLATGVPAFLYWRNSAPGGRGGPTGGAEDRDADATRAGNQR
jgi:APA family basic amino acid/polyamine antiporter